MRRGSHWADWVGIIGRVTSSSLQIIILQSSSSNLENSFPQFSVVRSIPHLETGALGMGD